MTVLSPAEMPFMKMHGLGNDFVVLDARERKMSLSSDLIRKIADRHRGVGFDQLAVIAKRGIDLHLTFFNADGSFSATCGNATRCVAHYLMVQAGTKKIRLITERGVLHAEDLGEGLTTVNLGAPQLKWYDIPLAREVNGLALPIDGRPTATGMGNPHCTFFVPDAEVVDVAQRGAEIEHHPLFPERTNVQFVSLIGPDHLRMRVWERGVGVTQASGSSSCAVAVAAVRRGLTGRAVKINLDGGQMTAVWRDDGVWLTGPSVHVFNGRFTVKFLQQVGM